MSGHILTSTESEKDLGALVDRSLNFHSQTSAAVAKDNKLLGIIKKSFASISKKSLPLLFKTLIRPYLEYGNSFWGPQSRVDQKLIERVQRRAMKLIPELHTKTYSQRLRVLNLPSLTYC